jgi:hypothetical protein
MLRMLLLVTALASIATPRLSHGQQAPHLVHAGGFAAHRWSAPATPLSSIPDSVRQKIGYQHWKGGAIGASVGALAGLGLAILAHGQCDDCPASSPPIAQATVIGAGLGGGFGFLVGLATPRYRWVPAAQP